MNELDCAQTFEADGLCGHRGHHAVADDPQSASGVATSAGGPAVARGRGPRRLGGEWERDGGQGRGRWPAPPARPARAARKRARRFQGGTPGAAAVCRWAIELHEYHLLLLLTVAGLMVVGVVLPVLMRRRAHWRSALML
jgi:hypothetical protein